MSDGSEWKILDEEGRLFGLLNIIDLLVVLLFLAVVVTGVVLLLPSDNESGTRFATVDMGTQPDSVAEAIDSGDEWIPEEASSSLRITDVYRFDTEEGTQVIVRARINGTVIEPADPDEQPTFLFRGQPLRLGQELSIRTKEYSTSGTVQRVQQSGKTLPLTESGFVLETILSPQEAEEIDAGDQFKIAGKTVAEVDDIAVFPQEERDGEGERYALVGLQATTIERGGDTFFGNTQLSVGRTVTFEGDGYEVSGSVLSRGTTTIDTEQHPFVIQTTVPTSVADTIRTGDTYEIGGRTVVSVETVTVYPTENANTRRVALGVAAQVQNEDGTLLFGDRQLRTGSSVPVETGAYSISGDIVRSGTTSEPGTPTTTAVRVTLDNIRPERANVLRTGMQERTRGQTTAEVVNVTQEPADVILESERGDIFLREHPQNKDIELTVELSVRELSDGSIRFRGRTLRAGQTLALELEQITVQGEVIEFVW